MTVKSRYCANCSSLPQKKFDVYYHNYTGSTRTATSSNLLFFLSVHASLGSRPSPAAILHPARYTSRHPDIRRYPDTLRPVYSIEHHISPKVLPSSGGDGIDDKKTMGKKRRGAVLWTVTCLWMEMVVDDGDGWW